MISVVWRARLPDYINLNMNLRFSLIQRMRFEQMKDILMHAVWQSHYFQALELVNYCTLFVMILPHMLES
jgi:hypothetical protein